jgi:hypothetical protein
MPLSAVLGGAACLAFCLSRQKMYASDPPSTKAIRKAPIISHVSIDIGFFYLLLK